MNLRLLSLLPVAGLIACGSSSSENGVSPTARISGAGTQSLTGQAAIYEAGNSFTSTAQTSPLVSGFEDRAAVQDKKAVAANAMNGGINKKLCNKEFNFAPVNGRVEGAAATMKPFTLKIKGVNCPLELELSMDMPAVNPCTEVSGSVRCLFTSKMKMVYLVRDEKLARELGTRSGTSVLEMKMDQTLPAGGQGRGGMNMVTKADMNIDFKAVDLENKVQLVSGTSLQDVSMMMGDMDSAEPGRVPQMKMNVMIKEDLRYFNEADKTTVILLASVKGDENSGEEAYLLNGASVTQEVYVQERQKFEVSLMNVAGGNQSGDPQPGQKPGTQPGPQPIPGPQQPNPGSSPAPWPNPPQPNPPTGGTNGWACVLQNSDKSTFIGYGAIELAATSNAKQACQLKASFCSSVVTCEKQEVNSQAWFCELKNYQTGLIFNSVGASKVEASYNAANECFAKSGTAAGSCQSLSSANCEHQ